MSESSSCTPLSLPQDPPNIPQYFANLTAQIEKFRSHPALLGYYICDDCTTQYLMAYEANRDKYPNPEHPNVTIPTLGEIYRRIKLLDPYHPIIGADESANVYTFTMANDRIPGPPTLDLVMVENYQPTMAANAHTGNWKRGGPGMDGSFNSWPLTWEPIVNCPGPWLVARNEQYHTDEERAKVMYGLSWLSAVMANLPMQLHFRLFPFGTPGFPLPVYENILFNGTGRYGKVVRYVTDYLFKSPSGVVEPTVQVVDPVPDPQRGDCEQCVRLWRKNAEGRGGIENDVFCALLVVVNTVGKTATVGLEITGLGDWSGANSATFRRIDGTDGEDGAQLRGGRMTVKLEAYDTHVYVSQGEECEGVGPPIAHDTQKRAREEEVVWV